MIICDYRSAYSVGSVQLILQNPIPPRRPCQSAAATKGKAHVAITGYPRICARWTGGIRTVRCIKSDSSFTRYIPIAIFCPFDPGARLEFVPGSD